MANCAYHPKSKALAAYVDCSQTDLRGMRSDRREKPATIRARMKSIEVKRLSKT